MFRTSPKQRLIALAILVAVMGIWLLSQPWLPHARLRDGSEFRVYDITYTPHVSSTHEHNLQAPRIQWRLYDSLPAALRVHVPAPASGIGNTSGQMSMLTIWWGQTPAGAHQPEIDEAGEVLMTLDSGEGR